MTNAAAFDNKVTVFKEHQEAPWGKLRYTIAAANLKRHMTGEAQAILDAGGGNGVEAVAFAKQGHTVALVDYSAEMLAEARKNAERNRLGDRIEIYQGDVVDIPRLFPQPRFDVALCHNVLQYVKNVGEALTAIGHAIKRNGIISIICINRYSEPYRLALQELNLQAAYAALDRNVMVSQVFDAPMTAFAAEDLEAPLQKAGFQVVGRYGIRCINDYIPNNENKSDPEIFSQIERLELAMSDKFPYYLVARSFHLVAQKAAE
jgi:S-adenosylmethionine-dependent methyltransferase